MAPGAGDASATHDTPGGNVNANAADLRIAVAGAGMVSRHHLTAWQRAACATVVAIADPAIEAARRRADEFAIPAAFASVEEMFAAARPDALDIAAPLGTHAALIEAAAVRGVAVLCQKPLASTAAETRTLGALAERYGVRLMVHENWRFRPHYRQIAAWLADGCIGAPAMFYMEVLGSGLLAEEGRPPSLERQPFLATMERLLVLEVLVHHIDTLMFLLGPLTVRAAATQRLSPHVVGEDTASVAFGGSVPGTLLASMAATGHPARAADRLEIVGREGRIGLEGASLVLDNASAGRRKVTLDLERNYQASYDGAIAHFCEALQTGEPFETTAAAHADVLERVEAIYALAAR